jgi:uncharacterized membrane protein YdbT with pleckstrin-like domain
MEPNQPTPPPQTNFGENPLNVMSPGEQVICTIDRHPIGLLGVYVTCGALLVVLFAGVALLPHFASNLSSTDKMYAFIVAIAFAALVVLFAYIAIIIYKGNRWIVTSDSITQVSQTGLFQKQTSQLSLGNLEDVTFEQNSLIQSLFGFGTLKVETAGERSKFQFPYCPSPQKCAVEIIQAHERFMTANPDGGNNSLNTNFPSSTLNTNTQA